MQCGYVCVFIIFVCQNGLLLSKAEENATITPESPALDSSTQTSTVQQSTAQDPVTQQSTQGSIALNSTAQDQPVQDTPAQELFTKDLRKQNMDNSSSVSTARQENTTKESKNSDGGVVFRGQPKLQNEFHTKQEDDIEIKSTATINKTAEDTHSDVTLKEETRKEETSTSSTAHTPPVPSKLTKITTADKYEATNKKYEYEKVTKDSDEVKPKLIPNYKRAFYIELNTTTPATSPPTPPKGVLDTIFDPVIKVGDDIQRVVSKGVDSAKDFADDAYKAVRSVFTNMLNR
ncbi:hypothetical protein HW555_000533 [Spodoptera exigua]|uniref:Uncharacterized protein n=1 Tax=Spodoptera exigua TaxID=7107 RepID=A0A835GSA2_SPOEX|nr:hypothetical protein HW555_000533 [Spodoptera exigua]